MSNRFSPTNIRARKHLLLSTAAILLTAGPALAQTPSSPASPAAAASGTGPVGEVVVTADPYANARTIAAKKEISVVSDGISANQIGELPEFGLGDALSAVPGVSFVINNGRGEDQFMTIRGLNPDYDSTDRGRHAPALDRGDGAQRIVRRAAGGAGQPGRRAEDLDRGPARPTPWAG